MDVTQQDLDQLISCTKRIVAPPRREDEVRGGHRRNGFVAEDVAAGERFQVFTRVLVRLPENFSIGLIHDPPDGARLLLLRYNGQHGPTAPFSRGGEWHATCHIHRADARRVQHGLEAWGDGAPTQAWASYEQALCAFLLDVAVENWRDYYGHLDQPRLPLGEE